MYHDWMWQIIGDSKYEHAVHANIFGDINA